MTQGNSSCNVIIKRNALFAEDLVKGSQGRERKEEGKEGSGNEAESEGDAVHGSATATFLLSSSPPTCLASPQGMELSNIQLQSRKTPHRPTRGWRDSPPKGDKLTSKIIKYSL